MTLLLSICIPTYQRAMLLVPTLERLAKVVQPWRDRVEVCLSDNGSTDGTAAAIAAFRPPGLRIKCIRQPENVGLSRNLAAAIDLAEGEYLLCQGDDDALEDGLCGTLERALAERPALALFPSLADQPLDGDWSARSEPRWLYGGAEVARVLGIFHLTFLGNFVVRRADYLAHDEERFRASLYPHVPVLLRILARERARWLPEPLFLFEEQLKSWNQPLLTAVDLARIYTDASLADAALYNRTVRSIPRALLHRKLGRLDQPGNPYASLAPRNLLECYRRSRRHQALAMAYWLTGTVLPASVLHAILGEKPRKVNF